MRSGIGTGRRRRPLFFAFLVIGSFLLRPGYAGDSGGDAGLPANQAWATVLSRFAVNGGVDYASLRRDRKDLDDFLDLVAAADPAGSVRDEQKAFWINSYNAVVLDFVLDRYPEIRSVMDVPGFFKESTALVAGEELTLDDIEARALAFGDPRVHFAVVCASHGCPGLRGEPYEASRLDVQLEEQTRIFLADGNKGARFDQDAGILWLSSIFKWYGGDFTGGSTVVAYLMRGKLVGWIAPYLPDDQAIVVREKVPTVRFLDYDWGLNDRTTD